MGASKKVEDGVQVCRPEGFTALVWGPCEEWEKTNEDSRSRCSDDIDNDQDGKVDEKDSDCASFCAPGKQRPCYSGADSTREKGECRSGIQVCGSGGSWELCQNEILPRKETCNQRDDDCNGKVDDGLPPGQCDCITPGASRSCFSGSKYISKCI